MEITSSRRQPRRTLVVLAAVMAVALLDWPALAAGSAVPVKGECVDFSNADPMSAADGGHSVTHLNEFGPPRFDTGIVPFGNATAVIRVTLCV